jgi:hypothetical protein
MSDQPARPQAGGSYVRQTDGSLARKEFTRQPHDPDHADRAPKEDAAGGEPAAGSRKRR